MVKMTDIDRPLSEIIISKKRTDVDLSLSDIITKKKLTLSRPKIGGIVKAKNTMVARPAATTMRTTTQTASAGKTVGDARNRIIKLKRQQFPDARDQIAKLAKTGDARDRINRNKGGAVIAVGGGIPSLMEEIAKPVDMRQKLNLQRGGVTSQDKKNFIVPQQQGTGLQTSRGLSTSGGQTRMQGNALVRTVSSGAISTKKQPQQLARSNTTLVQRQVTTSSGRSVGGLATSNGRSRRGVQEVIQEFHRSHPSPTPAPRQTVIIQRPRPVVQAARPRVVQVSGRRRLAPQGSPAVVYARPVQTVVQQQPQTVYRTSGGGYSSRASNVIYQEEPQVIYEDEPLEYADDYDVLPLEEEPLMMDDEPDYYTTGRAPSPVYQQQYAAPMYVSQPAPPPPVRRYQQPQQQQYGPPPPLMSRTPYAPRQQQQPPMQQQQQPRPYQQRPQQRPQQQLPIQRQPQQQRAQPPQLRVQQRQPVQQRVQPRAQQQQQTVRRAAPVARQVAAKVVGHKVVVSNLHPVATFEDIEELFGNIGPISSCKMPRAGTATIIFHNLSDAQKSMEVYHNRKLDGQPMQVKIVGSVTEGGAAASPAQASRSVRMRY